MLSFARGILEVVFGFYQPGQGRVAQLMRQADHKVGVKQVAAVTAEKPLSKNSDG